MSTCDKCKYFFSGEKSPACRRFPPSVQSLMVPKKDIMSAGMVAVEEQRSMFPSVRPDWYCGEWAPRIELTS